MKKIKDFKDLIVWQLTSKLSKEIAELVRTLPKHERYALANNFLRAARSIPTNIAEGWGRYIPKEKISFYNIAKSSTDECVNHVIEAYNNSYIDGETSIKYQKKLHVIRVKITNLMKSTRKYINPPAKRISSDKST